jgi:hypothetical protein
LRTWLTKMYRSSGNSESCGATSPTSDRNGAPKRCSAVGLASSVISHCVCRASSSRFKSTSPLDQLSCQRIGGREQGGGAQCSCFPVRMAPSGGADVYESPARVSRWRVSETASGDGEGRSPPGVPALLLPKLLVPAPVFAGGRVGAAMVGAGRGRGAPGSCGAGGGRRRSGRRTRQGRWRR